MLISYKRCRKVFKDQAPLCNRDKLMSQSSNQSLINLEIEEPSIPTETIDASYIYTYALITISSILGLWIRIGLVTALEFQPSPVFGLLYAQELGLDHLPT